MSKPQRGREYAKGKEALGPGIGVWEEESHSGRVGIMEVDHVMKNASMKSLPEDFVKQMVGLEILHGVLERLGCGLGVDGWGWRYYHGCGGVRILCKGASDDRLWIDFGFVFMLR